MQNADAHENAHHPHAHEHNRTQSGAVQNAGKGRLFFDAWTNDRLQHPANDQQQAAEQEKSGQAIPFPSA